MRISALLIFGVVCAVAPNSTAAQSSVIDPDASVVELRSTDCPTCTGCETPPGTFLDNCFETTADLTGWLWNGGRNNEPNSLDEVTVRVGPGTFDPFRCEAPVAGASGWVSVLGSGRDQTEFRQTATSATPPSVTCEGGITSIDCTNLSFSDLKASGINTGVYWDGNGDSLWESVDMHVDFEGNGQCGGRHYAWWDAHGFGETGGVHYFWNSTLKARGVGAVAAFYSDSESWFYGSDLLLIAAGGGGGYIATVAVYSPAPAGARFFGSTVRAVSEDSFAGILAGLASRGDGVIHMHGGIVNVNTEASNTLATGASTDNVAGFIHTPGTAFVLAGGTTPIRIYGPGNIQSPFIWPRGTTPPDIRSFTGADFFVKTNEGVGQNEARLFVFDASCSVTAAGPTAWRNMTTGSCI